VNKIHRLKQELNHVAKLRSELHAVRERLAERIHALNTQYKQSGITHHDYSEQFENLLGNRTLEEYERRYHRRIEELKHREHAINHSIGRAEANKGAITKAIILSAMMLMAVTVPIVMFDGGITGFATSQSTTTTATAEIVYYYALAESTDFSGGIDFSSLAHNTQNNNASSNYESSGTGYALNLSTDSNTDVSICVKANTDLKIHTSPSTLIGIGNMTFNASITNTTSLPGFATRTEMNTTVFRNATHNLGAGNATFFRFWLTVPEDTPQGTYNNSATFKAIRTGDACA
jgi:hypothetical protein